ncbi:nucleotide-diphospho-sugar transferase [Kalaharituber pfeilii]|nr:nucleotide-diphospho-sugar transferase [Kalaharituber pfeilii]
MTAPGLLPFSTGTGHRPRLSLRNVLASRDNLKSFLLAPLRHLTSRPDRLFPAIFLLVLFTILSTFAFLQLRPSNGGYDGLDYSSAPWTSWSIVEPHHAYVFYATNYDYACSALVNIDRLLHHPTIKTSGARIGVYLSSDMPSADVDDLAGVFDRLAAETNGRVFVIHAQPPKDKLKKPMKYYKDVLLKLVTFDLGMRDFSEESAPIKVERMIVFDADQLILRNLDHLFSLPPVEIAAPRNYWGSNLQAPMGSTSTLMVVTPSPSLWGRMQDAMNSLKEGEYDMDLLNHVFGNEILTLPGRYCTLNSHWEVNNMPFWYHHDSPAHEHTSEKWAEDPGVGLLLDAEVVHFTALGKPWSRPVDDVTTARPDAHWVFVELFGEWRANAARVCPGWLRRYYEV